MSWSSRLYPDRAQYRALFFLLFFLACASPGLFAQDSAIMLGDSFFKEGLYAEAVTEYMRFLHFNPGHPATSTIHKSASAACFLAQDMNGFLKNGRQSILTATGDAEKKNAVFAFVEWCLAGKEYAQADSELESLLGQFDDPGTTARAAFLLGVSALYTKRWERCGMMFTQYFKQTDTYSPLVEGRVLSLIEYARKAQYRDPVIASLLSALVPGLGQMYAGDFFEGLDSMVVNAATITLLVTALVNVRIPDAVMVYVFAFNRFYVGSSFHARRIAEGYNENKQQMIAAGIMDLLVAGP